MTSARFLACFACFFLVLSEGVDPQTTQSSINQSVGISELQDHPASVDSTDLDSSSQGLPIGEFLDENGHFDLDAARASGYQGPLNLGGMDIGFDPVTGEPIESPDRDPADDPDDVYWDNSISPSIPGLNGAVSATAVFEGKLIVGGGFSAASEVQANNITASDGSSVPATEGDVIPYDFALEQNYPNPVNPTTTIEFNLSVSSDYKLQIDNTAGQLVSEYSVTGSAGYHEMMWDVSRQTSSIHLYKLSAGDFVQLRKMMILERRH